MTVSSNRMLTALRLLADRGERPGLYVVPCRPDILYIPNAPVWATQVASP